ncbi:MAG: tetratricopeptide repeat protein [Gemmatimonadaceae bacterium]|nr:tetratricopeptide repeat protein [Gemmatimonadaceae bacterium]
MPATTTAAARATPDALTIACERGLACAERGDFAGAATAYAAAIRIAPRLVALHRLRLDALVQAGDRVAGGIAARAILPLLRDVSADEAQQLGRAALDAGAADVAVRCFEGARRLAPHAAAAHAALAAALRATGELARAERAVQQALALAPDDATALHTAAHIAHDRGDMAAALAGFDRAIARRPGHDAALVHRGHVRALLGDLAGGFADMEHRPLPTPLLPCPAWHGEPLAQRSVLVVAEQGAGDTLMAVRWLPLLHAAGAGAVTLVAPLALHRLLRANGIAVVAPDEPVRADVHVPLLSIPHRLALAGEAIPRAASWPYLHVPATAHDIVRDGSPAMRAPATPLRIGLAWQGNPAHRNDHHRSLDRTTLHALLRGARGLPIEWVVLQQGAAAHDAPASLARIVVTVDTGLAHLAGALGVRTWMLVPFVADWRWGMHGSETPWYPSLQLVRQSAPRDWRAPLATLHAALRDRARAHA